MVITTKMQSQPDMLFFYSKSRDVPPGRGSNERVNDLTSYQQLANIKDWRRVLSNFHVCEFQYKGKRYRSIEHAFQAEKIALADPLKALEFTVDSGSDLGLSDGAAAQRARKMVLLPDDVILHWCQISGKVMHDIAVAKYSACPEAREVLRATGRAQLWHVVPRGSPQRFSHLEQIRQTL